MPEERRQCLAEYGIVAYILPGDDTASSVDGFLDDLVCFRARRLISAHDDQQLGITWEVLKKPGKRASPKWRPGSDRHFVSTNN